MIVYSKKIIKFVHEIKISIKSILREEIALRVSGDRFYDQRQENSYPIKVVIYNNKSMLGYFDADFFELGFHQCLMTSSKSQLVNIIRHELAHYISFICYGNTIQHHGVEFKAFCNKMGWDENVSSATTCLEDQANPTEIEESSILRKVRKLMALATSSNPHEAEQAMIKSQQLLLKYNIDASEVEIDVEDKIYLKRIMKQKRENAKMRSIAKILETFLVNIVYCRSGDYIYLEVLGEETNVQIAEYVACILESKLEVLWKQAQQQSDLKGAIAKNSFFLGLAKGYCDKIQALKRQYNTSDAKALMIIEKKLVDARTMVYQRLSRTTSSAIYCRSSSEIGEQMGRQLNINPAIDKSKERKTVLIAFREST